MKSQFYTREMVEQRASAALRAYQQKTRKPLVLPIDAELVGEIVFELSWDWDQLDEPAGQRVLAALYVGEARAVLNERYLSLFEDKPGLEQYTRAHEVGHADLHVEPGQLGSGTASSLILHRDMSNMSADQRRNYWQERHADWYAAALLMPADRVIPIVRENLPQTATATGLLANQTFGVTYTAFNIRLKNLGFPYFDRSGLYCKPTSQKPNQGVLF